MTKSKAIAERVDVAGVSPATFKLVEKAEDSFDLFRSSRKIGTARVEPNGEWSAAFAAPDGRRGARAESAEALLRLVGAYLLTLEAREEAVKPLEESNPELRKRKKMTPEEKMSIELLKRTQARRIAAVDTTIAELRKRVKKAPKG